MKQPRTAGFGRREKRLGFTGRLGKALRATPSAVELFRGFGSGFFSTTRSVYVDGAYLEAKAATYAHIYRSQPNVRLVVDDIARVSANWSLRCYERQADGEREEDSDYEAMATMREPNDWQAQLEITEALFRDKLIYDDAYLWDMGADADGKRFLIRVPPHAMQVGSSNNLRPSVYRVTFQDGTWLDLAPDEVIHWRGYSPGDNRLGTSPMETLRTMILETVVRQAQSTDQVRGGLVKGGIITRPIEAPDWSEEAELRFAENFASRLKGVISGETPVLGEGMIFTEAGITPREAEMLQSRKFELDVVANMYGVNPAYYTTSGNLDAARRQMEEDVVAPHLRRLAETLTHQLIRAIYDDRKHFFAFSSPQVTDLGKLFEAGSKATGGSTMTTNEYRERFLNLPPIEGGDEIVKHPGSQGGGTPPAPDSEARGRPPTDETLEEAEKAIRSKALDLRRFAELEDQRIEEVERQKALRRQAARKRRERVAAEHAEMLRNHFRRQSRAHPKTPIGDDHERWDRELTADIFTLALRAVKEEGGITAEQLGGSFDMRQVENYLKVGAREYAKSINRRTERDLANADPEENKTAEDVFQSAIDHRADSLAGNRATQLCAFATFEAGKQLA